MALPVLTKEQRASASQKAVEARQARAKVKEEIKKGQMSLEEVFAQADANPIVGKMKVTSLLTSLPKVGKVTAERLMEKCDISPLRRVRGLGVRQRAMLLEEFAKKA